MHEDASKRLLADSDMAVQDRSECPVLLSAEQHLAILNAFEIAIIELDEQELITSWNVFAQSLLDMSSEALYQKPIQALYTSEEWEKITTRDLRQKGVPQHCSTQIIRNGGKRLDVDMMLSATQNAEGQATGSIMVFRKLPTNERLEEKVKEATRIKSEFVSVVSHELRTPLTSVVAGISIVLDGLVGKINEEQKDVLSVAQKSLDRLHRLINDLLDIEKIESGRLSLTLDLIDVNELVRDVHKFMLPSFKDIPVEFVLKLADNLPKIKLDRDRMTQVITNLVGNSIKFTEQGNITITTERRENIVQISVSDTGCGISEQDLPRAFQKFEQLQHAGRDKIGGTGLGLSISKEIIEQHRGKICGQSEEGKGTTFHIILPIIERRRARRKEID